MSNENMCKMLFTRLEIRLLLGRYILLLFLLLKCCKNLFFDLFLQLNSEIHGFTQESELKCSNRDNEKGPNDSKLDFVVLVSRRYGVKRRKSCLKLGFDVKPDRNCECRCQNRFNSIYLKITRVNDENRRRIEINFYCRYNFPFRAIRFYDVGWEPDDNNESR